MAVRGKIKNGRVLLEDPNALAEGTEVEVRPVKKTRKSPKAAKPRAKKKLPPTSFAERFRDFIGKAKGLPPDMSVNLDHYLYGTPRQE